MHKAMIKIIALFFILSTAAYGGYKFGEHKQQKNNDKQFLLLNYDSWATEMKIKLDLLKLMQEEKYEKTEEKLENYIDVTLASLGLYDKFAQKYPNAQIFDAIKGVKAYRAENKSHKVHLNLRAGVDRALNMVD